MCGGKYENLIREAVEARKAAYAPYSRFLVGAALQTEDGKIYRGCNIENASYPAGNCAERTAVFKAVSAGERKFAALAVVGAPENAEIFSDCPPCGICRQVLSEFCDGRFPVIYSNGKGGFTEKMLKDLLPFPFTKMHEARSIDLGADSYF